MADKPGPCCGQHQLVYDEYTATENGQPVDFHGGFHTYTAEWDETSVRYYVDGNLHYTVTEQPDRPIFETAKNIILNLAVGGVFGGDPNGSTVWPQTMYVDYVRYWQPFEDPNAPQNLLSNPGFDDNGGSLNSWTTFGNTIPNVSASNNPALGGSAALKIFGQFNGQPNSSGASQGVPITEGTVLRAEANSYSPSWDTLFGKTNDVTMKVEFYSAFGATYGSSNYLGEVTQLIHDGTTTEDIWHSHLLEVEAPTGAVEARLSFQFDQPNNQNGAIWIDSVGLFEVSAVPGDFDGDGYVGLSDLNVLGGNWDQNVTPGTNGDADADGIVTLTDLNVLGANWDPAPALSVPEPASLVTVLLVFCALGAKRKIS